MKMITTERYRQSTLLNMSWEKSSMNSYSRVEWELLQGRIGAFKAEHVWNLRYPFCFQTAQPLISDHLRTYSCRPWDEPGGGSIHGTSSPTPPRIIAVPCHAMPWIQFLSNNIHPIILSFPVLVFPLLTSFFCNFKADFFCLVTLGPGLSSLGLS